FGTDGGLSELLSTDSIYSTWLQFSENICTNNTIHLNPVVNYGTPPYTFAWQAIGNTLSCNNCQNPTATITQNSVYTVLVTDADNRTTADTLHVYACLNTAVNEVENEIAASIYPNPATGMLYVETGGADALTLNIYDLQGCLAISFSHPTTQANDISKLANGLYVAEILTPAGTARKRLVKM
ncbi:MAG TPA: T9SS type A sorting domain-containing protein, partial [Chitinophagales bacterium]|nr:T9SS type A sorting domain-containing protein [Chitinophagales bacterium]